MTTEAADEAQALIHLEVGRVRNGVVEPAEVVEIKDEFFDVVQDAVIEQLTLARDEVLKSYPQVAANAVADRLVRDEVITRKDATKVRDLVELEIRRGVNGLHENARTRYASRLPITLRFLIPLIIRRSGKS